MRKSWIATVAGGVVVGGAVLTASLWCLGSWIYRLLRAVGRRATLLGAP